MILGVLYALTYLILLTSIYQWENLGTEELPHCSYQVYIARKSGPGIQTQAGSDSRASALNLITAPYSPPKDWKIFKSQICVSTLCYIPTTSPCYWPFLSIVSTLPLPGLSKTELFVSAPKMVLAPGLSCFCQCHCQNCPWNRSVLFFKKFIYLN